MSSFAYAVRGAAHRRKGRDDPAIADLTRAIELNDKDGFAYEERGVAQLHKGNHDLAVADFTRAIELNDKKSFAYAVRGATHGRKGKHDLAIADLNRAIELNDKESLAYAILGYTRFYRGEFQTAAASLKRSIDLDGAPPDILFRYLARVRGGDASADARSDLGASAAKLTSAEWRRTDVSRRWFTELVEFYLNPRAAEDLLAARPATTSVARPTSTSASGTCCTAAASRRRAPWKPRWRPVRETSSSTTPRSRSWSGSGASPEGRQSLRTRLRSTFGKSPASGRKAAQ